MYLLIVDYIENSKHLKLKKKKTFGTTNEIYFHLKSNSQALCIGWEIDFSALIVISVCQKNE